MLSKCFSSLISFGAILLRLLFIVLYRRYIISLASSFMVVESLAFAHALFINNINEESSCFPLARLFIFSQAISIDGELSISSNLAWAVSNVSTISRVLS
uniref:Uncharacterized protein n=1 Tax=Opuntia streptacantha TaxID=393608 RepID=A0A7C9B6K2_OPUST